MTPALQAVTARVAYEYDKDSHKRRNAKVIEYVQEILGYGDDLSKISLIEMRGMFKAIEVWRAHLLKNGKQTDLPSNQNAEMAKYFAHFVQSWKSFRHALTMISLTGEDDGQTNKMIDNTNHLYEYFMQCVELAEMLDDGDEAGEEDRTDFVELAKRNNADLPEDPGNFITNVFHGFSALEDNLSALKKHFDL